MRKKLVILVITIAVITAGSILFFKVFNKKPVVGILISTTESYSGERAGVLLALKQLPNNVEFVNVNYADGNIRKALEHAIKMGVRYFVGLDTSSDVEKIEDLLSKSHSILIESQVTNPQVVNDSKYVYTISPTDDIQARAIAAYIRYKGYRTILIVKSASNAKYVNYLSNEIVKDLKGIETKTLSISDISSINKAPNALVLIMSAQESVNVMQKIESKFGKIPFIGSDWSFRGDVLMRNIKISEGMITVGFVNLHAVSSAFENEMADINLQVTSPAILAHDAVIVTYDLAKNRIPSDRVYKYLGSHIFLGERGNFSFKAKSVNSPIYFYEVLPLNFKLVWTFGGEK